MTTLQATNIKARRRRLCKLLKSGSKCYLLNEHKPTSATTDTDAELYVVCIDSATLIRDTYDRATRAEKLEEIPMINVATTAANAEKLQARLQSENDALRQENERLKAELAKKKGWRVGRKTREASDPAAAEADRLKARAMRESGATHEAIAAELHTSKRYVARLLKRRHPYVKSE